jgi:hypothetical protein
VIQVQLERKRAWKMMMWMMRHMCHHPGLILMAEERALPVPVAVGQQEMKKLRKKLKKMMVMTVTRRKKYLMYKKSILLTMCT